ncbi:MULTISPECIES: glutaredoxin family protein [unclassified Acidovorax]|uniref:glutaredoxin family protein n=1 Tax=unclassified Acidovorax TaxID=2684926 RepID=UPI002883197E|nr:MULTISPECIES: glutaredoxin family protein [unclassified Acidovorax]
MNTLSSIALLSLTLLGSLGNAVHAQQVYRSVGPDGRVTFSDRSPAEATAPAAGARNGVAASNNSTLPYGLAQVATRFPVTLYTGNDCSPCASARNLLVNRGVPFTERTVNSNEDIDALKRLSGAASLPFGTIGGQQLSGFSDVEWTQYLDAAGYPKQSQLPANYRRAAASPLVVVQERAASPAAGTTEPANPARARTPVAPPTPPVVTPANPAGITF